MSNAPIAIAVEAIVNQILLVRARKVILDTDLAALYGVTTKRFNEQVRRNAARFPEDFMFRLSTEEWESLRSQFATLKAGRGQHRKYLPLAFTEHGAIMAATILASPRATEISVYVVRAFVQMRDAISTHKELARKMRELEARIERRLDAQDHTIFEILDAIKQLMAPTPAPKRTPIGFVHPKEK